MKSAGIHKAKLVDSRLIRQNNNADYFTEYLINSEQNRQQKIEKYISQIEIVRKNELKKMDDRKEIHDLLIKKLEADKQHKIKIDIEWNSTIDSFRKLSNRSSTSGLNTLVNTIFEQIHESNNQRSNACNSIVQRFMLDENIGINFKDVGLLLNILENSQYKGDNYKTLQIWFKNAAALTKEIEDHLKEIASSEVNATNYLSIEKKLMKLKDYQALPLVKKLQLGKQVPIDVLDQVLESVESNIEKCKQNLKATNPTTEKASPCINSINPSIPNTEKHTSKMMDEVEKMFPYCVEMIRTSNKMIDNAEKAGASRTHLKDSELNKEFKIYLNQLDKMKSGSIQPPTRTLFECIQKLSAFLTASANEGGSKLFTVFIYQFIQKIFTSVASEGSEQGIIAFSILLYGTITGLPHNMKEFGLKLLQAYFIWMDNPHEVNLHLPVLICPVNQKQSIPLLEVSYRYFIGWCSMHGLMATTALHTDQLLDDSSSSSSMQGSSSTQLKENESSPFSLDQAWKWLIRTCIQLSIIIKIRSGQGVSWKGLRLEDVCRNLHTFLRLVGHSLWLNYQMKMNQLLKIIQKSIDPFCTTNPNPSEPSHILKLNIWLKDSLAKNFIIPKLYKNLCFFSIKNLLYINSLEDLRNDVDQLDKDETSEIKQKMMKQYELDRLEKIFNRLGLSESSQQIAINSLLEKIVITSHDPETRILKYTLLKITENIMSECEDTFLTYKNENKLKKIPRLTCGLCAHKRELANLFRMEFFRICPLALPLQRIEEGYNEDDAKNIMGYIKIKKTRVTKSKTDIIEVWEDDLEKSDTNGWLGRMKKLMAAFSMMLIQPEQTPFTYQDGWNWLSRMINESAYHPNDSSSTTVTAPFYFFSILEIFLKITTPCFNVIFGIPVMMGALKSLEKQYYGRIENKTEGSLNDPPKIRVKEFLKIFFESFGKNCISLFAEDQK